MTEKVFTDYQPAVMMQAVETISVTNEHPALQFIRETRPGRCRKL